MRVLINGLHSKSGGGVTYLNNIIPALARDPGLELHILLHSTQFEQYEPLAEYARLHAFGFRESMIPTLLWEQTILPILVRMMDADVVYSPANYGPLFVRSSVVLARNSLSVVMKDARLAKIVYWAAVASMTILSLLAAKRAMAVSHYAVDNMIHWPFKWLGRKVSVVNHGVSPQFKPGGTHREGFLLAVGDIYIQKNYHTLLEAFHRLLARHPNATLAIAGRPMDRSYAENLKNSIRKRGLEDKVRFLGHVPPEDLRHLYQECRVFVFPSTVETFGNPLVEAMACGASIACSNRTAMPEIAGDAVEYFDPDDPQSMAATIERLLTDEARRAELSARAIERAAHFSWPRCAEQVAEILKLAAR